MLLYNNSHISRAYPFMSVRPYVDFKPTTPQREEGIRTDPVVSHELGHKNGDDNLKVIIHKSKVLYLYNLHHQFLMQQHIVQKLQLLQGLRKIHQCIYLEHVGFLLFCILKGSLKFLFLKCK